MKLNCLSLYFYFIIWRCIYVLDLFDAVRNQSSNKAIRVNQKNRKSSWEEYATWGGFNFWPITNIFQIRVWLWLVHKITEIHCRPQFFSEVIQTQKKYSTFFYKISILSRGGSRTAATSKMEYFVIIVNGCKHSCFPVNFSKFLRTPFLQNTSNCFWKLLFAKYLISVAATLIQIFWYVLNLEYL